MSTSTTSPTPSEQGFLTRALEFLTRALLTLAPLALVPVMAWLLLEEDPPFAHSTGAGTCARPEMRTAGVSPSDGPPVPLEHGGGDQTLALGRSRDAKTLTTTLTLRSPEAEGQVAAQLVDGGWLHARPRSFTRASDAVIPPEAIRAWAQLVGNQVDVSLCVMPEYTVMARDGEGDLVPVPRSVDPGTYTGSVLVNHPGVVASSVPFIVTRSFERWWSVVALAALSSMAAIVWIYILRTGEGRREDGESQRLTLFSGHFVEWVREPASFISIAAGSVGAAAVYSSTYLRAEDWGASAPAFLSFIGAVFTAFLTAATAGKLAENVGHRDERKTRKTRTARENTDEHTIETTSGEQPSDPDAGAEHADPSSPPGAAGGAVDGNGSSPPSALSRS